MASVFLFCFATFFLGILGLIIGGMFKVLIIENEAIESPIVRIIFFLIFFSPVYMSIVIFSYILLTGHDSGLGPKGYGALAGLLIGGIISFIMVGRKSS